MKELRKLDVRTLAPKELKAKPHASILSLQEVIPLLASPDNRRSLDLTGDERHLSDGEVLYPIKGGAPILVPQYLTEYFTGSELPLQHYSDPKILYFLLSQLKQKGETNASPESIAYQRHLFRLKNFLADCKGTLLDVGCDDALIGASLLNPDCRYVGLEPFTDGSSAFKVVGVGECLPFQNGSLDNVLFNTSLDHILDYHEAILEAARVLKPGGTLFLCTLIWENSTSLLQDTVHFHHFKDYEITGVVKTCGFAEIRRETFDYKGDPNRFGLYLEARKSD